MILLPKAILCAAALLTVLFTDLVADPMTIPFSGPVQSLDTSSDLAGNIFVIGEVGTGSSTIIEVHIYLTNQTWLSFTLSPLTSHLPSIISDYGGNAMAAWQQENGTYLDIYASHYNGSVWSTGKKISSSQMENSTPPMLKFFSNSEILALWKVNNTSSSDCFLESNIFSGLNWKGSSRTTNLGGEIASFDAGTDQYGNILTCFDLNPGSAIYAIAYNRTTNLWGIPDAYTSEVPDDTTHIRVGDLNRLGFAAWRSYIDNQYFLGYCIYSSPYIVNHYLATAVDRFSSGTNFEIQVASTSKGTGVILWQREESGVSNVYGTSITLSSNTISETSLLSTSALGQLSINLAQNAAGEVIGTWRQLGTFETLQQVMYDPKDGFLTIENIYSTSNSIKNIRTSLNDNGDFSIAWTENNIPYLFKGLAPFPRLQKKNAKLKKQNNS